MNFIHDVVLYHRAMVWEQSEQQSSISFAQVDKTTAEQITSSQQAMVTNGGVVSTGVAHSLGAIGIWPTLLDLGEDQQYSSRSRSGSWP